MFWEKRTKIYDNLFKIRFKNLESNDVLTPKGNKITKTILFIYNYVCILLNTRVCWLRRKNGVFGCILNEISAWLHQYVPHSRRDNGGNIALKVIEKSNYKIQCLEGLQKSINKIFKFIRLVCIAVRTLRRRLAAHSSVWFEGYAVRFLTFFRYKFNLSSLHDNERWEKVNLCRLRETLRNSRLLFIELNFIKLNENGEKLFAATLNPIFTQVRDKKMRMTKFQMNGCR